MDPVPSPTALQKLRVVDLKERLSAFGLSTSGLKADLVKRLRAHYVALEKEQQANAMAEAAAEEETAEPAETPAEEPAEPKAPEQTEPAEEPDVPVKPAPTADPTPPPPPPPPMVGDPPSSVAPQQLMEDDDANLRMKVEIQKQMIEQEELKKDQEKEALGWQQQIMLAQQEAQEKERVAKQQQMILAEKEQQRILAERQQQEALRLKEVELLQQQQLAIIERQREETGGIHQFQGASGPQGPPPQFIAQAPAHPHPQPASIPLGVAPIPPTAQPQTVQILAAPQQPQLIQAQQVLTTPLTPQAVPPLPQQVQIVPPPQMVPQPPQQIITTPLMPVPAEAPQPVSVPEPPEQMRGVPGQVTVVHVSDGLQFGAQPPNLIQAPQPPAFQPMPPQQPPQPVPPSAPLPLMSLPTSTPSPVSLTPGPPPPLMSLQTTEPPTPPQGPPPPQPSFAEGREMMVERSPMMENRPPQMGERPLHMGERPPQMGDRPPQMGDRPPMMGERPPHMGDRPPHMGDRPPHMGERPPHMGDRPPQMGDRPPQINDRPPHMGDRPPQMGDRPPMMNDRPPQIGDRPMMGDRPPHMGDRPQHMGDRPPMMGDRPPMMGDRPPMMGGPPVMGDRPPQMSDRPPVPGDRGKVPDRPLKNEAVERQQNQDSRGPQGKEIRLPQALEKVLAFKDVRAQQVGVSAEDAMDQSSPLRDADDDDDEEEEVTMEKEEEEEPAKTTPTDKESKNKRRKKKKKKAKKNRFQKQEEVTPVKEKEDSRVEVEYVQEQLDLEPTDPNYYTFAKIFEAFKLTEPEKLPVRSAADEKREEKQAEPVKSRGILADEPEMENDDDDDLPPVEEEKPKMSKKKLKKLTRLSVAELKQLVTRPDVVEMHDVTAQDPRLLVHLKATRNTVPVPRHWCFKRKYLQGKRGIEKPPFELPEYIQATGIMEMRQALQDKEDQKTMKAKMREKVRPKLGKIDIDYQKLHDAFFKWQTKPKMTIHGDLYYEGKEFETKLKEKKPGNLSDDLKTALGMPVGASTVPPPWLIAMQRYGPPPSYPNLKIPGLNAPIPENCAFGYHAGGWGKPPVDETGKPLYGDVFGTQGVDLQTPAEKEELDKTQWGELESESESEESSSEEESEEEGDQATGLITPAGEGLVTPSGMTSIPVGVETPDMIELRKRRIEDAMDQGGDTPALYTVLPEKKTNVGGAMMGSAHIYDIAAATGAPRRLGDKMPAEGVEVALNPDELDMDTAAMQAKYDQTVREQQSQLEKEDLTDMVAEHAAKQKKRKKQSQDTSRSAKKYKEFKF